MSFLEKLTKVDKISFAMYLPTLCCGEPKMMLFAENYVVIGKTLQFDCWLGDEVTTKLQNIYLFTYSYQSYVQNLKHLKYCYIQLIRVKLNNLPMQNTEDNIQ